MKIIPTITVRVDDVGKSNDIQTQNLLSALVYYEIPFSCQIVPSWVDNFSFLQIKNIVVSSIEKIELCQHGWSHFNHAKSNDRKFEFGDNRKYVEQEDDIIKGKVRLKEMFQDNLSHGFCPPYNRLNQDTVNILAFHEFDFVIGDDRTFRKLIIPNNLRCFEFSICLSHKNEFQRIVYSVPDLIINIIEECKHASFIGIIIHGYEIKDIKSCYDLAKNLKKLQTSCICRFSTLSEIISNHINGTQC